MSSLDAAASTLDGGKEAVDDSTLPDAAASLHGNEADVAHATSPDKAAVQAISAAQAPDALDPPQSPVDVHHVIHERLAAARMEWVCPDTGKRIRLSASQWRERDAKYQVLKSGSLEEIANLIKSNKVKRILVLAGAGISTSAGIPDFRSPKTGLYQNLQKYNLPDPQDIFCIEYFLENPTPFYELAKELYPGNFKPTRTHFFIKLLSDKHLLLKAMTQNIGMYCSALADTLETVAGIPPSKLVEAHGSFATAKCVGPGACGQMQSHHQIRANILQGNVPHCKECGCVVKPNIVFFGEALPNDFHDALQHVLPQADLVLIMGTSLQVAPFCDLVDAVRPHVPRVLINNQKVGERGHHINGLDFAGSHQKHFRDVFVQGSCDDGITQLADLLGWKAELELVEREYELNDALDKVKL